MEESTAASKTTTASNNSKQRTHRSREWERQRRLKFNEAISKLGELVKAITKANSTITGDNAEDNAQYPKIEIVQKAITCLANCAQEKTQLKADILALEVKLEAIEKIKLNRRDVSLQVTIGVEKKYQRTKSGKLILQKDKQTVVKEKIIKASPKPKIRDKSPLKLPKLLPLSNIKKDTIVMLPAAPYIFPQRPVLFPTVQPTLVLVDANMQALNRPTPIPIINKTSNDITKTTMVNVLPISAYSRPLSAVKSKKSNTKVRNNSSKKSVKKCKPDDKESTETDKNSADVDGKDNEKPATEIKEKANLDRNCDSDKSSADVLELDKNSKDDSVSEPNNTKADNILKPDTQNQIDSSDNAEIKAAPEIKTDASKSTGSESSQASTENNKIIESEVNVPSIVDKTLVLSSNVDNSKYNKSSSNKTILTEEKPKENKLTSILDPSICENVVDGGNARLELAEEFLAASPTAAFLMSFPLVSGNRADSPAEEPQNTPSKSSNQRSENNTQSVAYFEKPDSPISKAKTTNKTENPQIVADKNTTLEKSTVSKTILTSSSNMCNDNPFLTLPIQTNVTSSCTLPDPTFGLDFDCNLSKAVTTQHTNLVSSNNLFYKSDPLNTVKSTIYSTSSISTSHDYNSLGLYPCAVENYPSKNKADYNNTDEALMKINSSRLTYDIDLGWSQKSFDFVNCTTTTNTFHKDNMLNTTATAYSTSYNPFNPDFHVPLVSNHNKKNITSKSSSFPDPITSFYAQSTLWSEDIPNIYTHSNVSKTLPMKQQNYVSMDHAQPNLNPKANTTKQFDTKQISENTPENILKTPTLTAQHIPDKFTKKSPNKMHINWMTSEVRPMPNNCNPSQTEIKQTTKLSYPQQEHVAKKQTSNDNNYLPINMHHFPNQPHHDDLQVWPAPRPAGTTEISIEPPPINLPTLVGDLALGPHDRKKNELLSRAQAQNDLQNCSNFFSVTQLMNRSSESVPSRSNGPINEGSKVTNLSKQPANHGVSDSNRKINSRVENHPQLCYVFNDPKMTNSFDNINQYTQNLQNKNKPNKSDKSSKVQKNSYSAEALIRGGPCSQKLPDSNSAKYLVTTQKYNDFNLGPETGVAQVSHFPSIPDYSDNNYLGQQFSGTTLYNTTTNTISNSFYSNFMPGSTNLMSSNYAGGPFTSDFTEYNQSAECNYNHKYPDVKMRTNGTFQQDKESGYKNSTRRESAAKHKLECSKKDTTKKYQSKRAKVNHEAEEWNDTSHLWQNKNTSKRHPNIMADEPTFSNYVGNQMPAQYQPEYFNSHLVPSNSQNIGPSGDRSLSNFPVASRANFNLSALFPEITMKVQ